MDIETSHSLNAVFSVLVVSKLFSYPYILYVQYHYENLLKFYIDFFFNFFTSLTMSYLKIYICINLTINYYIIKLIHNNNLYITNYIIAYFIHSHHLINTYFSVI